MFGAATFHAAMAEIVVGCMVLASLCAIGCATGSIMPNFLGGRLSSDRMMLTMDKASIAGACLGLLFIPIAALSGSFAADNTVNNALLYNKFVYTGLAAGFWAAFVIGRIRLGPGLWEHRSLSSAGCNCWNGYPHDHYGIFNWWKVGSRESLFDIMPIWLPSDTATVLNPIVSIVLMLIGTGSLFAVLRLGPQPERIETDQS